MCVFVDGKQCQTELGDVLSLTKNQIFGLLFGGILAPTWELQYLTGFVTVGTEIQ